MDSPGAFHNLKDSLDLSQIESKKKTYGLSRLIQSIETEPLVIKREKSTFDESLLEEYLTSELIRKGSGPGNCQEIQPES